MNGFVGLRRTKNRLAKCSASDGSATLQGMRKKDRSVFRLRRWLREFIQKTMPRSVRHFMLRRFLALDFHPSPRLKVRLATSQQDLEAAFQLLHSAYVGAGFMDPHPSNLRVTKYHSLPATSTIIALWDDEVVGTLSLVRRSSFGMPLESIFDVTPLMADGKRVFETSSLAVHPKFAGKHGMILFPLIKFLFEYGMRFFGSNYMAIAVNPAWIEFYESVLKFKKLSAKTVDNYSFVKGAPAVGAYVNLDTIADELKELYRNAPPEKNLYRYLFAHEMPNLEFPVRNYTKISDPVLTPKIIDYFFRQRTEALSDMSDREVLILHQLYQDDSFRKILPPIPDALESHGWREASRIEVCLRADVMLNSTQMISAVLTDVSNDGLGIIAEKPLRENHTYTVKVEVDGRSHFLKTSLRWFSEDRKRCGLLIEEASPAWTDFTDLLTDDLLKIAN